MKNEELLGRIPTHSGGVGKTYPESIIRLLNKKDAKKMISNYFLSRNRIYLEYATQDIVFEEGIKGVTTNKELELLNICPVISGKKLKVKYLVEVIEKDVLYRHLKEEKEYIELLKEQQLSLSRQGVVI